MTYHWHGTDPAEPHSAEPHSGEWFDEVDRRFATAAGRRGSFLLVTAQVPLGTGARR
ncbi:MULTISPECIES: hypothetical protein [unclassified Pseudofrankia]|uniref:hypothetical protein n=1 Tax=unclassified Pseudofrankia TaxID=2994372 RepID=UPI0012FF9D16|nr:MULTISPECIES: hypothetical protein [unclassified Pseudofrankia]MDT3443976.1 hypothetical protein [Pseudofrankia sp. BMG5.37]